MNYKQLTLSGINFGKLFVQKQGASVSLMISSMDGVNNPQIIGLTAEQAKQLSDFLRNVGKT